MKEDFLSARINERIDQDSFRELKLSTGKIDFCSNDYLGIVKNRLLEKNSDKDAFTLAHGSTGSRLLTGNYGLIERTEDKIAKFHDAEAALIFNSGYDANLGIMSAIAGRGDTIIYDQLSHASIRDGIRLSLASGISFLHNDCKDLEKKLQAAQGNKFVVTETIFSMDGDYSPLNEIVGLCKKYDAHLIVDEAHAIGVIGKSGEGLSQMMNLHKDCLARIYTYGKGPGCHGAAITGSRTLRKFLINFARSFIFTTAMPPLGAWAIQKAYDTFPQMDEERKKLEELVGVFSNANIPFTKLNSESPIQVVIIPGNSEARFAASVIQDKGFDVRAILYPTVPKGLERLRIVLHAFNTVEDLGRLIDVISFMRP
ncbi:MAG: 8-amino-7-oxononanoate synthase [Bacteroidetes bacterium]|nr:MAG: 8-amino-7-oxononanoate synthase [Bacteroidota bacterium]